MVPPSESIAEALACLLGEARDAFQIESMPNCPRAAKAVVSCRSYFVYRPDDASESRREAEALRALRSHWSIKTPSVVACDDRLLATEWIDAIDRPSGFGAETGRRLAMCHRSARGGPADIGSLYLDRANAAFDRALQSNRVSPCLSRKLVTVLHKWDRWFADVEREAVWIHGDLRPSHVLSTAAGPAVVRPRTALGSREADAALYFPSPEGFLEAYEQVWTLPAGFRQRRWIYRIVAGLERLNRRGFGHEAVEESVASLIADA